MKVEYWNNNGTSLDLFTFEGSNSNPTPRGMFIATYLRRMGGGGTKAEGGHVSIKYILKYVPPKERYVYDFWAVLAWKRVKYFASLVWNGVFVKNPETFTFSDIYSNIQVRKKFRKEK